MFRAGSNLTRVPHYCEGASTKWLRRLSMAKRTRKVSISFPVRRSQQTGVGPSPALAASAHQGGATATLPVKLEPPADTLYNGAHSTAFSAVAEDCFKESVGEFEVLRQLSPEGVLADGVELPFSEEVAVEMYRTMLRSSVFDGILLEMQRQGRISFYCTNWGEEATAVGSAAALSAEDMVWPQYRELGMFLWRGLSAQQIVDQNIGNEEDVGKGRNLQVHYCMPDANVQTVHAVLGTHIPQAPGAGYAYRVEGADRVSVAYFGDGAVRSFPPLVSRRRYSIALIIGAPIDDRSRVVLRLRQGARAGVGGRRADRAELRGGLQGAGVSLYDSTFSRTVWRLYGGAKGIVMLY